MLFDSYQFYLDLYLSTNQVQPNSFCTYLVVQTFQILLQPNFLIKPVDRTEGPGLNSQPEHFSMQE